MSENNRYDKPELRGRSRAPKVNRYSDNRFYQRHGSPSGRQSRGPDSLSPQIATNSLKDSPGASTSTASNPAHSLPAATPISSKFHVPSAAPISRTSSTATPAVRPNNTRKNKQEKSDSSPKSLSNGSSSERYHQRKPALSLKPSPSLKQRVHKPQQESNEDCPPLCELKPPQFPPEHKSYPTRRVSYEPKPSRLRNEVVFNTPENSPTPKPMDQENRSSAPKKMNDSDTSDEIMLHRGSRFRGNNRRSRGNSRQPPQASEQSSSGNAVSSSARPQPPRKPNGRAAAANIQDSGQPNINETRSRQPSSHSSPSQQQTQANQNEVAYQAAPSEALDELKKLQQKVVTQAHLNRLERLDYPTANPEALAKVRDGPGTDIKSDVYKELAKFRVVPDSVESNGTHASVSHDIPSSQDFASSRPGAEQYMAQWKAYKDSPPAFPVISDGKIMLESKPGPKNQDIDHSSLHELGLQAAEAQRTRLEQAPENNWADAFFADWEYRPRACSNFEAFRDCFRHWLDSTMAIACYADINHQAFFDGTSHADGVDSFLIPDLEDGASHLDMDDEKTRLHFHETVEGYCYNFALIIKKEEKEEDDRRQRARTVYIQALRTAPEPNLNVPRANCYLRPVELNDIPELIKIYNWYIRETTLSVDIEAVQEAEARQRIEDCRRERLPFIVAAERKAGHRNPMTPERILGYALATDSLGQRTTGRFTVELELFVRHDSKRRGIGRCLMDKLLEVCDPTYIPKHGYYFGNSADNVAGYGAGGCRRLARLIFKLSVPSDDRNRYQWVEDWLEEKYQFKEQGFLKGGRVRNDKFLDVCYLVRNVGFSEGSIFKR